MAYIESIRGVFTQHINKENENIAKTNFKRQPGKNSPTKSTISNSVQKQQQNRTFSDAMRNQKSAGGAFSHHIFSKKCQEQFSETHCKHQSTITKNNQNFNNFARGATN